ncbi:hypothetical protein SpiGrapes_2642 [Sphaerochaeta pleomorpha str. Grapes]|uniref:DUF3795 domain-containing protein n=1 Tax=Sphaerochaeta pleomorpha (strain ATCC BAA-1885 / DSM 22778 / Grapes) TaxID=158190 RepID=G8QV87_SPHPG|nr:DUF3795 domain-containing protein [Sphaerochaeta pleomorpha]AEV30402.1 hypothetical protein SpiGrapes_2642 [Sphaerochaeta pleomorpha str. Grapes]
MEREKGFAFCGLACCVCSENADCPGCRNEGCKDKQWCKNFLCCKEKGLDGCYQCDQFPCTGSMLDKPRILAFSRFLALYGEEKLFACLQRNEEEGIVYHYPGKLTGDYDTKTTEKELFDLILYGKEYL